MPWTYTIANEPLSLQTSSRNRDPANGNGNGHNSSFAIRSRNHAPHLSISDDSHHVTETIGFLYGNDNEKDPRRTSNAPSIARSSYYSDQSAEEEDGISSYKNRSMHTQHSPVSGQIQPSRINVNLARESPLERPNGVSMSPINMAREQSPQETAQSQFPLNDIDYESSPAAVAQELSNLQALRRMSMDVHAAGDPDLPALNPAAIPPSPTASDDDDSRLFWVPARLHPELAPKEFKSFLESKAEQIKRRSGDLSSLGGTPATSRSSSLSVSSTGLSRKKSMLSREVNSSAGFRDGADILERHRSMSNQSDPNLAELGNLVANSLAQRPESPDGPEDFILPSVPASSLKRSTKTRYQRDRGGLKARGDRTQRVTRRLPNTDAEQPPESIPQIPNESVEFTTPSSSDTSNIAETLAFPTSRTANSAQNFSRPATARSPSPPYEAHHDPVSSTTFDSILGDRAGASSSPDLSHRPRHVVQNDRHSVPHIIETPPDNGQPQSHPQRHEDDDGHSIVQPQMKHPARTSSRESARVAAPRPTMPRTHSSANVVPKQNRTDTPPLNQPQQSLTQPSPLPGVDTNTSNLSFVPTLTVDRQSLEKKEPKKSSWGWLIGKDEEKEKAKSKSGKTSPSHDNTRLDLLQTSIDGNARRRETIEIDRDGVRLEEERKKESQRKSSAISEKKEKDSIFSSLFSSKKSKAEKEAKKSVARLSPEPRAKELKADIDYSWTRFSILEERAIYRMAHIKLANPRRPLYSQVLLSNFMYSYLAKVQQMHPQMNLPTSAKHQKKQKEQQPVQAPVQSSQSEEFSTYQRYQQVSRDRLD